MPTASTVGHAAGNTRKPFASVLPFPATAEGSIRTNPSLSAASAAKCAPTTDYRLPTTDYQESKAHKKLLRKILRSFYFSRYEIHASPNQN